MRISKVAFRRWLKRHRPEDVVGRRRDSCGCPLARFYRDASGGHEVAISEADDGYYVDRGFRSSRLPEWAGRFARLVDCGDQEALSAERCLKLLRS